MGVRSRGVQLFGRVMEVTQGGGIRSLGRDHRLRLLDKELPRKAMHNFGAEEKSAQVGRCATGLPV